MFGVEPTSRAGALALEIYAEVLDSVRADRLVAENLRRAGDLLFVQGQAIDLQHFDRIFVCGAGKASTEMAAAAAEVLGSRLAGGLLVTRHGSGVQVAGLEVVYGSHPLPDELSMQAGEAMLRFADSTTPRDLVIFCLSGGASALMEAPISGVSLGEIRSTTDALMRGGADIKALNAVRIRLSRIKGGGLARAFHAHVIVLVLSDVMGNDLSVVGSGPFMAPRRLAAHGHAAAFGLDAPVSDAVRQALTADPGAPGPPVDHYVVGGAAMIWPIAHQAAVRRGLEPVGYADPIRGEARTFAARIIRLARAKRERGDERFCMVFAGESTVKVRGAGRGGRCQEMATRAASELARMPEVAFLAAGTDGADGPTDAAGGLVESDSSVRAGQTSARGSLARNDSYHFLEACGGLIRTGPTGSNVNDVALVVHEP